MISYLNNVKINKMNNNQIIQKINYSSLVKINSNNNNNKKKKKKV